MTNMFDDYDPDLVRFETTDMRGENLCQAWYDGEKVYTKHATDTPNRYLDGMPEEWMQANIAAGIVLNDLDIGPDMVYDKENRRLVMEDVGVPVNRENREHIDTDRYIDAVVAKYLVGDGDIGGEPEEKHGNITVDKDGICHPIDFDQAGKYHASDIDIPGNVTRLASLYGDDVTGEDVDAGIDRIADQLDADRIRGELSGSQYLQSYLDRDVFLHNLDWFTD